MTALNNRVGPTRIWKTLNGMKVKSNDGKDLGKIKKISKNYLLLQKGKVRKHRFWIPKYIADAFDGKTLWLLLSEEEVRGKYQYGKEPPAGESIQKSSNRSKERHTDKRLTMNQILTKIFGLLKITRISGI